MSVIYSDDGKKVIEFITKTLGQDLPKTGLLAGQAIATVLLYLKGKSSKVEINDYDIFLPLARQRPNQKWDFVPETFTSKRHEPGIDVRRFSTSITMRQAKLFLDGATMCEALDYDGMKRLQAEGSPKKHLFRNENFLVFDSHKGSTYGYNIKGVFRRGLLNYVFVNASTLDFNTPNPWEIINHFDINCTQVAIDLSTQKIYYTKYFQDFLFSKQMIIVSCHRPDHTFIRFMNKLEQHDYFGNVELAATICSMYKNLCVDESLIQHLYSYEPLVGDKSILDMSKKTIDISKFGSGYIEKYKKAHGINSYARLELSASNFSDINGGSDDHTAAMILAISGQGPREIKTQTRLGNLTFSTDNLKSIVNGEHKRKLERNIGLPVSGYIHYLRSTIPAICNEEFGTFKAKFSKKRFVTMDEIVFNTKTKLNSTFAEALFFGQSDLLKGSVDIKNMQLVNKLIKVHPNLGPILRDLPIEEQVQLCKILNAMEKKHPEYVFMIESEGIFDWQGKNREELYEMVERDYKIYEEKLKKRGRLKKEVDFEPVTIDGFMIQELISQSQLDDESNVLRHCVRTYGNRIRNKSSYIISFRKTYSNRATLELRKIGNYDWRIVQFRTIRNKKPNPQFYKALDSFMLQLSEKMDKKREEDNNIVN